jgi:hypothetical protein
VWYLTAQDGIDPETGHSITCPLAINQPMLPLEFEHRWTPQVGARRAALLNLETPAEMAAWMAPRWQRDICGIEAAA